jgi:hypothetical protein
LRGGLVESGEEEKGDNSTLKENMQTYFEDWKLELVALEYAYRPKCDQLGTVVNTTSRVLPRNEDEILDSTRVSSVRRDSRFLSAHSKLLHTVVGFPPDN